MQRTSASGTSPTLRLSTLKADRLSATIDYWGQRLWLRLSDPSDYQTLATITPAGLRAGRGFAVTQATPGTPGHPRHRCRYPVRACGGWLPVYWPQTVSERPRRDITPLVISQHYHARKTACRASESLTAICPYSISRHSIKKRPPSASRRPYNGRTDPGVTWDPCKRKAAQAPAQAAIVYLLILANSSSTKTGNKRIAINTTVAPPHQIKK